MATDMEQWYDSQDDVDRGETAEVVGSGGDGEPVETISVDHSPDEETDLSPTETNAVPDAVAVDDTAQSNRERENPDELLDDDGQVKDNSEMVNESVESGDFGSNGSLDDGTLQVDDSAVDRISDAAEEQGSTVEEELGQTREVLENADGPADVADSIQNGEIPTTVLAGASAVLLAVYFVGVA